jgi:large subunit ribosomal protein L13
MVTKLKPYNPSVSDLEADWHVLDARGQILGRLATQAAMLLMGKHRPEYVPHMLSGDFVVITNAAEVATSGNKADHITYMRHSQKPGNLKEIPFRRVQEAFPERIIEHAVRGMLPKNKLGERMIRRLKVYAGEEHPHASQLAWTAQRPEREAAEAAKAEEAARSRAASKTRAAAKKEIAESATAKAEVSTTEKAPAKKPSARATAAKKPAKKAAAKPAAKKPAAKKPAAKKTSTTSKAKTSE